MTTLKKFLPKLYPVNKEISKTWYVCYTGKDGLQKKEYGKLNHLHTIEERIIEGERLIAAIIEKDKMIPAHGIGNQLIKDLQEVFDLRKTGWSLKSVSAFQTHFYTFATWYRLQGCPPMDVRQAMRFLNTIVVDGSNNTTRNNYRNNLKSLFRSLTVFFKQRYSDNCFADTPLLGENRKTKEWFRPGMVEHLLAVFAEVDKQLLLSVKIMFHCFARPNEIRLLKIKNIIWETKKLRIESNFAKTEFVRHITIPDSLYNDLLFLKELPEQYYIFGSTGVPGEIALGRDTLSKRHKSLLTKFKYDKGFTFYGWKNTGAVKMLCQDKRNLRYISKCMGHHSLDMTDNYLESIGVDEMIDLVFPQV